MNRKPKALVAAVALALAGTLLLVGYARSSRADASDARVPVLVATAPIAAGTAAADLDTKVAVRNVAAGSRAAGAVTSLRDLRAMVASSAIASGDQLRASDFVAADALPRAAAPDGTLEVSLSLDPARALAGDITPGQTVAVIASFDDEGDLKAQTRVMLQDIVVTRVHATDPISDNDGKAVQAAPGGSLLVTLAVPPADAERVVFAAEHGHLWLAADSPEVAATGTPGQQRETVLR